MSVLSNTTKTKRGGDNLLPAKQAWEGRSMRHDKTGITQRNHL